MMMILTVKQSVELELAGETEVSEEILPKRHLQQHEYHITRPGIEAMSTRWETGQ
jgi:hypothetical protein